jgi:rhodanese-related sulfurtransferase
MDIFRKIFSQALILLLVSVVLSLAVNAIRADGIPLFATIEKNEVKPVSSQSQEGVGEISLDEAVSRYEKGEAVFVDARMPEDYRKGHIKGAKNLPDMDFDSYIDEFYENTDFDSIIITYCDGEHCRLGKMLAEKLDMAGFENVYYLKNGYTRWKNKSQPVEQMK